MLNRNEHCASYHAFKKIESDSTFSSTESQNEAPYGIDKCSNNSKSYAFGNFDQFA